MKKWISYRPSLATEKYDAIIIGSGISGLTSGALLAQAGKKVLILEKHFKAGGWTHTFKRKNYEWDVGIHYIGDVHKPWSPMRKLFDKITEGKLEWYKMNDNYDRIIFPDKHYNFICPKEKFLEEMVGHFPSEKEAIQKYLLLLGQSTKGGVQYFTNKALPAVLGSLTYPFMSRKFLSLARLKTYDALRAITNNEKLISVLAGQWGDHGLPPKQSSFALHAMIARHYLDGGNYPIGSSRRIAETITDVIEKHGGRVAVNTGVDEILIKNSQAYGVLLDNGVELYSSLIISSSGIANSYRGLLRNSANSTLYKQRLKKLTHSDSFVCLYVGLNNSAKDLGLSNTNLWIYPGYDHDKNVADYQSNNKAAFPVLYVSFPSAKDPVYQKNFPNNATMEIITLARWDWYNKWASNAWKNRGEDYETEKEVLAQKMLKKVFEYVPQARGSLDYYELSTPLTVKSLANYQVGEMYGLNHSINRFKHRWIKPKTEIKGFFLTGQDVLTVGVSSALLSGLMTASAILKKNLFKEL